MPNLVSDCCLMPNEQLFSYIIRAFNIFQVYQYFNIYKRYFFLLKFEQFS